MTALIAVNAVNAVNAVVFLSAATTSIRPTHHKVIHAEGRTRVDRDRFFSAITASSATGESTTNLRESPAQREGSELLAHVSRAMS